MSDALGIVSHPDTGAVELQRRPRPVVARGQVLVATTASLISAGTERMLVEFGRASLLGKAKAQPEKVQQVLEKMRADGILPTLEAVFNRLGEPLPLGYCNAGRVVSVGAGVEGFAPGDRVVTNGPHAELVCVPRNLCAKIPEGVSDEHAAAVPLASIALQAVRLAAPTLGERVVVYGLGLLGLMTVQLLVAAGCSVLGVDVNPVRVALAKSFGARAVVAGVGDPLREASSWSGGLGVDAVLVTASAKDDQIVHEAAQMCRKRGRIVLVGVVSLDLRRADFYEKELTFQVSCSYGPGRYDPKYEQGGQDYPFGLVRWTVQRNFEAILGLLEGRRLRMDDLVSHRVPFAEAPRAYQTLLADPSALGVVLQYPREREPLPIPAVTPSTSKPSRACLGVVGAGNFSKATLMPALTKTSAQIKYVCSRRGDSAAYLAQRHHIEHAISDYQQLLGDPEVSAVVLAVGHEAHAPMTVQALQAGKHVFVEKPLALDLEQLKAVREAAIAASGHQLLVGFNRRFSPHVVRAKHLLEGRSEPLTLTMTVNAGDIPPSHWVHDPERGGGRIVGEGCHFIDLMVFLCGSPVAQVAASQVGEGCPIQNDKVAIVLKFADGSVGNINYFANGAKAFPKEELTVFSDSRVLRLENFRALHSVAFRGARTFRTLRQDKGHQAELSAFVDRVASGGPPLIPFDELLNVTLASFAVNTSIQENRFVDLSREYADAFKADAV